MWRALAIAIGVAALLMGVECLAIEKVVLQKKAEARQEGGLFAMTAAVTEQKKEVKIPEWAPWSLMSVGAIIVLYNFALPKQG